MSRASLCILTVGLSLACSGGLAVADEVDERTLREAGVSADGPSLLRFFRSRVVNDADRVKVEMLIRQLGDESFNVRERASATLVELGPVAEPLLRDATDDPDPEVKRRAEECLRRLARGASPDLIVAAARMLAERKPDGAAEVLLAYVPFVPDEMVTESVHAVLAEVGVKDGQPEPAVVAALTDKLPAKRAAAAVALAPVDTDKVRTAVRKLLEDDDTEVRLQAALALAEAGDRDAVTVLIDLLGVLSPEKGWSAEDILFTLAGEKAPSVGLGRTKEEREKCRSAWAEWWKKNGAGVDLTVLGKEPAFLGHTVVVQLDMRAPTTGRVVEYGRDGKARWQIEGLRTPRDAQVLPGDRVLVAEYSLRRVSEWSTQGKLLWQQTLPGGGMVLGAQRLRTGHTFVVTRDQLLEMDRDGKIVFSLRRPSDISTARKLRNGDVVLLTNTGTCIRLDAQGKELSSFPASRTLIGGGFEVLPSGGIVMADYYQNRIVEYDARGKPVWEVPMERPSAVSRLPNGHVLVTSAVRPRVVEIDRQGKEVWQMPIEGRPYRAFRR